MYVGIYVNFLIFLLYYIQTWVFFTHFRESITYKISWKSVQWEPSWPVWLPYFPILSHIRCDFREYVIEHPICVLGICYWTSNMCFGNMLLNLQYVFWEYVIEHPICVLGICYWTSSMCFGNMLLKIFGNMLLNIQYVFWEYVIEHRICVLGICYWTSNMCFGNMLLNI